MKAKVRVPLRFSVPAGLILTILIVGVIEAAPAERGFLLIKYGDESAEPELAAEFLQKLASFLEESIDLGPLKGWIANTPDEAARMLHDFQPILVLGPPGFYFQQLSSPTFSSEVLVQVPRLGSSSERYVLVVPKRTALTLDNLRGKVIKTVFAFDSDYLKRVVFPKDLQPGVDFRLEPSPNLADEMFLFLEEPGESSAAALLLDTELAVFFQQDELVWPELRVVWQSEELPRDLVIAVGQGWTSSQKQRLRVCLMKMQEDPVGAELLDLMSSPGLELCNLQLLERARVKFNQLP